MKTTLETFPIMSNQVMKFLHILTLLMLKYPGYITEGSLL